MLKNFYPYEYVEDVFSIDYNKLYNKGYRGIIFDIDNTLVPHGKSSTEEIDELFKNIHKIGFKTLLLSDNGEKRINKFIENIDTLYISNAQKPKKEGYIKATKMLDLEKKEIVYIGDQVFKDIYGANKSRIDNILVKYIGYYNKEKKGIRRNIEKMILKIYQKNNKYQNRIGDIHKEEKRDAIKQK